MRFAHFSLVSCTALAAALPAIAETSFNRIASFDVSTNLPEDQRATTESSAEIIDVTADGMILVYSDSPVGAIGLIDITDPAAPAPMGNMPTGRRADIGRDARQHRVRRRQHLRELHRAVGASRPYRHRHPRRGR